MDWNLVALGTAAGFGTAAATFFGALPVLFGSRTSVTQKDVMLGFAAGVMLSASYLSLIVPASNFAAERGASAAGAAGIVAFSVLLGAVSLDLLRRNRFVRRYQQDGASSSAVARVWLLIFAMTAHNIPEGAAVGVAFGAGEPHIGISTAIGIGVQDIPEGLAVAAALLTIGASRKSAVLIAGATGLVEPVGAFLGAALVSLVSALLPWAMGWAAGAMLYIVAAELIPAVHSNGSGGRPALAAITLGLVAMLFLDIALS